MKIRIMTFDDWEGLYIDDKLVEEGHSIPQDTLIKIIRNLGADIMDGYLQSDLDDFGNRCPKIWPEEWDKLVG